jgi:CHAT domain-containing protein/Tfp pilus assembly protein PilF
MRLAGFFLLTAGIVLADDPLPDPQLTALADQIFVAKDAAARAAVLDAHRDVVSPALARTMNRLAGQVFDHRDFAKARDMYEVSCEVAGKTGARHELADCTFDMGLAEVRLQRSEDARRHLEASVPMYTDTGDFDGLVKALNSLGVLTRNSGDYRGSLAYFQRALDYTGKAGETVLAQTNTNIATSYIRLGNHKAAIDCLQKALAITQRRGMMRESGLVLNNLASAYFGYGDMELAANYAEQALAIKEKTSEPGEIASSVLNVGVVQQAVGRTAEAKRSFERAMKLTEEPAMLPLRLTVMYNYGNLLFTQGAMAEAKESFTHTAEIAERAGDPSALANARVRLARIALKEQRFAEAESLARSAVEYGRSSGEVQVLMNALDTQGVALRELKRPDEAQASFEEAIRAIEETRTHLAGEQQSAVYFMEERRGVYLHMAQLQLDRGNQEAALAYVERSKARSLLDTLKLGNPSITTAMTPDEAAQERELARNLQSIRDALLLQSHRPNPDRKQLQEMRAQLEKARTAYRSFEASLYATHPKLKLHRAQFDPVAPRDLIAAYGDPATALLEYLIGDAGIHLFVVTSEGLKVYHLTKASAALQRDAARFRKQIADRDLEYRTLAASLYQDLLAPAAAQLKGKTTLVIAPDGFLWDVPFQALAAGGNRSLLETYTLSYTPSLTVLHELRKLRDPAPANPSVLAVNALDLPAAKREVDAMRQVYGAPRLQVLAGAGASREALRSEASKFDVVHVAAHGVFDNRSPLSSYLMLGEGTMEAREMMDLNLHARMVVLSGCETGRGEAAGGEGLLGMSWALFIAGTPATVASQWKVESDSTSRLMLEFHRNARREPRAKALRDAALAVMKNPEWRHPFYWSGFVVIGDGF